MDPISIGLAGAGILSGILGNRPRRTTTNYNNTTDSNSSATVRRYMPTEVSDQLPRLNGYFSNVFDDPQAGMGAFKQAAVNDVNKRYAQVPGMLRQKLRTGYGQSGKFGTAMRQAELGRLNDLTGVDLDYQKQVMDRRQQAVQQIMQLLGIDFGRDATETSRSTQTGQQTSIGPGNMVAGGIGGGVSGLLAGLYGKKEGLWK